MVDRALPIIGVAPASVGGEDPRSRRQRVVRARRLETLIKDGRVPLSEAA